MLLLGTLLKLMSLRDHCKNRNRIKLKLSFENQHIMQSFCILHAFPLRYIAAGIRVLYKKKLHCVQIQRKHKGGVALGYG